MPVGHDGGVTSLVGDALRQRCIETVVEEGERFGIVAQELATGLTPVSGGLDAPVPWVPAWRARDLIGHLGTVHRWATYILRAETTEPPCSPSIVRMARGLAPGMVTGKPYCRTCRGPKTPSSTV